MKKFLIITGVLLLLILGAIWTYLFIYGTPASVDEIFARFEGSTDTPNIIPQPSDAGVIDVGNDTPNTLENRLRQLTTRPVAGAVFIENGIRYVERGTGHIYNIDLSGGEERIISGTTQPQTVRAVFSPSGGHVLLTREIDGALVTTLAEITRDGGDAGNLTITSLPQGAREAAFSELGELVYFFVPGVTGGSGYSYTLSTKKTTTLFTIPLRDIRVLWGKKIYVYTTPSAAATGYLYEVRGNALTYIRPGGFGLVAAAYTGGLLVGEHTSDGMVTNDVAHGSIPLLTLFPEKCVGVAAPGMLYCATPLSTSASAMYPDDWYKGTTQFSDILIKINAPSTTSMVLSKFEEESGRPIDVHSIGTNGEGNMIYLINKFDNALWMFDARL